MLIELVEPEGKKNQTETCVPRTKPVAIVTTAGLMLGNLPMSAFSLFIERP